MKKKKNFLQRFFSPSPAKYKHRAANFGILALSFTAAFGAVKALSIATPQYFDLFVGAAIFIFTGVATYCQQKTVTPEKK